MTDLKYELVEVSEDEISTFIGRIYSNYLHNNPLYRLRALKNFSDVKKGELGGYVTSGDNLSQIGNCWVYDKAFIKDDSKVTGNVRVKDNAIINNSMLDGTILVKNNVYISDSKLSTNGSISVVEDYSRIVDCVVQKNNFLISGKTTITNIKFYPKQEAELRLDGDTCLKIDYRKGYNDFISIESISSFIENGTIEGELDLNPDNWFANGRKRNFVKNKINEYLMRNPLYTSDLVFTLVSGREITQRLVDTIDKSVVEYMVRVGFHEDRVENFIKRGSTAVEKIKQNIKSGKNTEYTHEGLTFYSNHIESIGFYTIVTMGDIKV